MLQLRLFGPAELVSDEGPLGSNVLAQPKRLALLAYLVAARPLGFHRRDSLLGMFWPELDQERGRAALRQALYTLRRSLPEGVIITRGDGEVGVEERLIECDVVQFSRLRARDPESALSYYRGDLLQGFFVSEAPAFEHWLEEERARLKREAGASAWEIAERVRLSDPERAVSWARRAAALDPFNEEALRRLMRLFDEAGQRANALQVYQDFERFLERELDTAPSDATQQLAELLRAPPVKRNGNGNGNGHGATPYVHDEPVLAASPPAQRRRPRLVYALALATLVVAGVGTFRMISARSRTPVIAVGEIRGITNDTLAPALRDMLATSLARIEDVQVISNTALLERTEDKKSPQNAVEAARDLRADRLLEGSLHRTGAGTYRLALQWLDLRSGKIMPAAEVQEHQPFDLIDAATTEVAQDLERKPPALQFASVSTNSFTAYRLYEAGLRAYYRGEIEAARHLLAEALDEDSTFAIAQWYYSRVVDYPRNMENADRAVRLAVHASDREQLFIRASWLVEMDDPRTVAVAETLAIRYPAEPDGHLILGRGKLYSGDFMGALPHLRRVVQLDTASLSRPRSRCRACDAMAEIATAYAFSDSAAALLRFTRKWTQHHPQSNNAWFAYASALDMNGRLGEALRARERATRIPPENFGDQAHTEMMIRVGNFEAADRILTERIRSGNPDLQESGYWIYALSLRNQQRYQEALHAARSLRYLRKREGNGAIYAAHAEAQVLIEMGRVRAGAALMDTIARARFTESSTARNARAFAGGHARVAEAYYRAGDTVEVKKRLKEIEHWAPQTSFAFARKQHHYIRGLLYLARGNREQAITELRRAVVSPTHGSLRINYYLSKALIESDRPMEAIPYLNAALRGPVGGGGYSTPHRELHELAATAWRAVGNRDSAAVHQAWLNRMVAYRAAPVPLLTAYN